MRTDAERSSNNPDGSASGLPLPTPAETAARGLSAWIRQNPDANVGGVAILRDHKTVVVYWKGTPPPSLRSLADRQTVPVTIQPAAYSLAELEPIAKQLVTKHNDVVSSAGPSKDYSGVSVTLWSKAKATTKTVLATLNSEAGVPVHFDRYADPESPAAR